MLRTTKTAEVQQSFGCTIKHNPHAIHQVNNGWSRLTHAQNLLLVGEKVAAINRVVKVFPRGIAFPFGIDRTIDTALCTHRVRALDRHPGEQFNRHTGLSDFDGCHQTCQTAADDDDCLISHAESLPCSVVPARFKYLQTHAECVNAIIEATPIPARTTNTIIVTHAVIRCARAPTVMP